VLKSLIPVVKFIKMKESQSKTINKIFKFISTFSCIQGCSIFGKNSSNNVSQFSDFISIHKEIHKASNNNTSKECNKHWNECCSFLFGNSFDDSNQSNNKNSWINSSLNWIEYWIELNWLNWINWGEWKRNEKDKHERHWPMSCNMDWSKL